MRLSPRDAHPRVRLAVELLFTALAALALYWAWRADLRYCERHLLPRHFAWDDESPAIARRWRKLGVVVGLVLLFVVRPLFGRWAGRRSAREALVDFARYAVAVLLALVVSEIALRVTHRAAAPDRTHAIEVRIGQPDARLGWVFTPSKKNVIGHMDGPIEYAVNADGNRASSVEDDPDYAAPTLLFSGESITVGHGLPWEDTYPAIVGKAFGLQVVDLGVHGYGSDQAFVRLADRLARFKNVIAVVSIFHPPMLVRMRENDHPHLVFPIGSGAPVVTPPEDELRITRVFHNVIPYHDDSTYEGLKEILRETDRRARAQGAKAVFVYPQFDHEVPRRDAWMVDELFHEQGLTVVDTNFGFEPLPGDPHPNGASTRRLAEAIVEALRGELPPG